MQAALKASSVTLFPGCVKMRAPRSSLSDNNLLRIIYITAWVPRQGIEIIEVGDTNLCTV